MPVRDLLSAASTQGATPADPYFYDVSLLLNGDGTNGAQNNTFLDSSTNNFTITRNGNTTQGSFSPYGSLWSNYFGGSSGLTYSDNSAFHFSGDFTFEFWIQGYSYDSNKNIGMLRDSSGAWGSGAYMIINYFGGIAWYTPSGQVVATVSSSAVNQWNHIAFVRSGSTITAYTNGIAQNTWTDTTNYSGNGSPLFRWGYGYDGTYYYITANISNLRITKSAVYTANFTPSTTPLTVLTNTSFLTCQSNRFIDNSTNNLTPSGIVGTPSVQRFSPFNPTAPYSTSVIGGSGYFDGSGDYLTTQATTSLNFGTNDFTVEGWIYTSSTSSTFIYSQCSPGAQRNGIVFGWNSASNLWWLFGDGSNWVFERTPAFNLRVNSWVHLAVVRQSGTARFYANGVQVDSIANTTNLTQASNISYIGGNPDGFVITGYISNFRIVNGSAVYPNGTTFTPPTAPVTKITNTQLLTNYTNAGIPDLAMMNNLETVGNAQVSTSVVKYGTGSLSFDGSTANLYGSTKQSLSFGTGDFTVEAWFYMNAQASGNIQGFGTLNTAGDTGWVLGTNSSGKWRFVTYGTAIVQTSSGVVTTGTWTHLAVVRQSGTCYLYVNGISLASNSNSFNFTDNIINIGTTYGGGVLNGYLDDIRLTNGYCRYPNGTTFTPPTAALPTY